MRGHPARGRRPGVVHVDTGHIDRDRHAEAQLQPPGTDLGGDLLPHVVVELLHEAIGLEQGYEDGGADAAEFGVEPPDEGLCARQARNHGLDVELGLVVDLELTLGQGLREVVDELLGVELGLEHGVVEDGDGAGERVLDRVDGLVGAVEAAVAASGSPMHSRA